MNGQGSFKCLGDSGATQTAICKKMAKEAQLEYEDLKPPKKIPLASSDASVNMIGEVRVRLEIHMGSSDTITIRDTPIWIIEEDMEVALLGDDVLVRLGIDVRGELNKKSGMDIDYIRAGEKLESFPPMGGDKEETLLQVLEEKVATASSRLNALNGNKWRILLKGHVNEFRTIMSFDPPAQAEPLEVHWNDELAKKVKPNRISYTSDQKSFMDYYAMKLIKNGFCYENSRARYVSEVLILPKVERPKNYEEDWRMVVNLKKANACCHVIFWPLPTLEDCQQSLFEAKYYVMLDLKNGYWQIRLHVKCQELFSFTTHRQVLTPTRIVQGTADALMYFTYVIARIFKERMYKGLLLWVDDLLIYGKSIEEVYDLVAWVLEKSKEAGLKFNPKKLILMTEEITWCGKTITANGVSVDPKRKEALGNMPLPKNGADLMQFVNAANWIRTSLPEFAKIFFKLSDWMNLLLKNGRRTSRRAKGLQLEWDVEKKSAFQAAKDCILNAVTQAHPNPEYTKVLFTDASDLHWGAFLGQIKNFDIEKEVTNQPMEPLYFLSGTFRGSQCKWATPDKEGYAIVEAVERLRYLLICPKGFRLYTDHRNLRFMYSPWSNAKLNVRARLDRWALKLQGYRFDVEHVAGELNLWADLLSRWGAKPMEIEKRVATPMLNAVGKGKRNLKRHVAQPNLAPMNEFDWPTKNKIRKAQQNGEFPTNIVLEENHDGLYTYKGRVWIPDDSKLRWSLLVIAHYGLAGHYGTEGTYLKMKEKFYWPKMKLEIDKMIQDCILCRCGKSTMPTRTHQGKRERPTRPNQFLHFDWYTVGESYDGDRYILVIRDAFSRMVMLVKSTSADAASTASALMMWIAIFGVPERFFSDNGSHFRNKVMEGLARLLDVIHDFSTVYCAWSNGLVERVNRDIKALIKILLVELKRDQKEWPIIVSNIMFKLNQRPSRGLAGNPAVKVHTGLKPSGALDMVMSSDEETFERFTWNEEMLNHLKKLEEDLDMLHKEVTEATTSVDEIARRHPEVLEEYEIGDYVLYCKVDRVQEPKKHDFTWIGPCQVMDIKSQYVYEIRSILSDRNFEAHVSRMTFYSTMQLEETGELKELVSKQGMDMDVDEIHKITWDTATSKYVITVSWRGLCENEISHEPFDDLFKQIPRFTLAYLEKFAEGKKELFKEFWIKKKNFILKFLNSKKILWEPPK